MYRYPRNACPQLNTSRSTTRNAIAQRSLPAGDHADQCAPARLWLSAAAA